MAAVSGTVTDASTGAGVADVTVSGSTSGLTSTDADGRYTLTRLTGRVSICVDSEGVQTTDAPDGYVDTCSARVKTTAGKVTSLSIALAPAGVAAGTVTDTAGDPLQDVDVSSSSATTAAFTGQDGTYQLSGLTPGPVTVCFDGSGAQDPGGDVGFGTTCQDITVTARQTTGAVDAVLAPAS